MLSEKIKIASLAFTLALTTGLPQQASASDLNISQNPLFLATSIDPNIMFTLDDSGSMHWENMPDGLTFQYFMFPRPVGLYGGADYPNRVPLFRDNDLHNFVLRSANNNAVFYNPDRTYRPWVNWDGTEMAEADPHCALYNPRIPALGCLNLTQQQTADAIWSGNTSNTNLFQVSHAAPGLIDGFSNISATQSFTPITYFNYIGGDVLQRTSYQVVEITVPGTPASATFTSPGGVTRTRDEEIQNFANWFQYHRSRILTSRAGIGRAFLELPGAARLGFAAINAPATVIDGVSTTTIIDPVRPLTVAARQAFYDRLYDLAIPTAGTPLRRAANDVGQYFSRADNLGPWSHTPGVNTPGENSTEHLSCRQSFHILMTDGFWNGPNQGFGNVDNANGPLITGPDAQSFQYIASDPFRDTHSDTLGDIAMHYWKRDLRTDIANRVPTNPVNPAFWQHVSTYGIGFGVQGTIDPDDAFDAIDTGTAIAWPDPSATNPAKIDDLLHFGLNGRGGFFSAGDPDTFAAELGAVLQDIVARAAATTGVAVSATRLTTDTYVYTGDFDSSDWSGQLRALDPHDGSEVWSGSDELDILGHTSRNIITYDPVADSALDFDSAATAIETRVMAGAPTTPAEWTFTNVVNYLRGDDALEEGSGGPFRDRSGLLGDLVNSRPVFSGKGNEGWARKYADYIDYIDGPKLDPRDCGSPCARRETVFIGANDGMLHAFDARTGREHFAFIPAAVHENLHELADPGYSHRFFVDGQISVADARIGSGAQPWRTVLVGGLGAGGRSIYALDVTEPQNFSDADVLWEFTHSELGFTYGEPLIARLEDGTWVAVFGNGYNSVNNQAVLFVVDLKNGTLLHKKELGATGGNGLSGLAGWRDVGTRSYLSRVYAGDLNGTIWRVDFNSSTPDVKYAGGLFTDPNGRAITGSPNLAAHPSGGVAVYVGTGKLIENDDRLDSDLDRFYVVRDRDAAISDLSGFTEAEITAGPPPTVTNSGGIGDDGWFMDLTDGVYVGERVLAPPRVIFGRVILATYQPIEDPCQPGGVQRAYVLDALTGDANGSTPVVLGTGAPFVPPISIRPQTPPDGSSVTFPGDPDPGGGPPPFPPPPAPTGNATVAGWCSEFGIPPLFVGGSFLPLGTICEGRQIWREVR